MARGERKIEGGGSEQEEAMTMMYLHSLVHYSSHLLHNMCFFSPSVFTCILKVNVNTQLYDHI